MTIMKHELRQGRTSFLVWTAAIGILMAVCICLFPEMKGQMEGISKLFASMGAFTAAFGMDRLNFGSLPGYYAIECGNVLGLGGAFYAALCAVDILSKEERGRTAEFLLTHPVSRAKILAGKLAAVLLQITVMNVIIYIVSVVCLRELPAYGVFCEQYHRRDPAECARYSSRTRRSATARRCSYSSASRGTST